MNLDIYKYSNKVLTNDDVFEIKNALSNKYVMWSEYGDSPEYYSYIHDISYEHKYNAIIVTMDLIYMFTLNDDYNIYKDYKKTIYMNDIYSSLTKQGLTINIIDKDTYIEAFNKINNNIKNEYI